MKSVLAVFGVVAMTLLVTATGGVAREVVLPEPQGALLVLAKGEERMAYVFNAFMGGTMEEATSAGLSWDDSGLTAVIDCQDSSIVAAQGAGSGPADIWKHDCVELLLEPGHNHGAPVCILASAVGAVRCSRGADAGYRIEGLGVRTVRTGRGWRATIFVPWKGLGIGAPAGGEIWGLNIRRIDQKEVFSVDKMTTGSWVSFRTDPHEVLGLGHVAFMLPGTIEDDAKLAAMRETVAAGHERTVRAWAGPNDGDVLALGRKAITVPRLGLIGSDTPARQATRVTLARDTEGLEVRFECEDGDIVAVQEGRDNVKIWKDDCVYLLLDPGHRHDAAAMVMVQMSASGVVHDIRNGDPKWTWEGMETETARTATGWSAHLKLPWRGLGISAPKAGEVWGINLVRMDQPGKADYRLMEMSSLAVVPGGDPASIHRWGHLAFGKAGDVARAPAHEARRAAVDAQRAADAEKAKARQTQLAARYGLPANPNANEDVRRILAWIAGLPERKDQRFFLSQHLEWGDEVASYGRHVEDLAKTTGRHIAMIELSYQDPSYHMIAREHLASINQAAIRFWKDGHLVAFHWNPMNPWTGGYYNDLRGREQLADILVPGKPAHTEWMKKLDKLAELFTELRDAGVVVLWRPLHEMTFTSAYWYDYGATKNPEDYKNIWRHMFTYFSKEKKLDNLIWVFSAANTGGVIGPPADCMYPGGEYVDIVGLSLYGDGAMIAGGAYERLTALGKPFALSEFGPTSLGQFDNLDLVRAIRGRYPKAVFANYWDTSRISRFGIYSQHNAPELLQHPWVISRENLMKDACIPVPQGPGHGVEPNPKVIAK